MERGRLRAQLEHVAQHRDAPAARGRLRRRQADASAAAIEAGLAL